MKTAEAGLPLRIPRRQQKQAAEAHTTPSKESLSRPWAAHECVNRNLEDSAGSFDSLLDSHAFALLRVNARVERLRARRSADGRRRRRGPRREEVPPPFFPTPPNCPTFVKNRDRFRLRSYVRFLSISRCTGNIGFLHRAMAQV